MATNNYPSIPELYLKTDILSTDTSFKLRSILWYTGSDGVAVNLDTSVFGSSNIGYGVFEPRTSRQEFFTWDTSTVGSAATTGITILSRGLPWGSDYSTSSTARKFGHSSGAKVLLFTDAPALWNTFLNKANDETVTGKVTFPNNANYPVVGSSYVAPTSSTHIATKGYVDATAVAGAPDATTVVKGIIELATGAELAAGTATGGTGANLVPASSSCKSSSAGAADANKLPVLNGSGVLDQTFLDSARTWGAAQTFTAARLLITTDATTANEAVRKSLIDGGLVKDYVGDGSDGAVTLDGANTYSFFSKSGSTYTLQRDVFLTTLVVNSGSILEANGYRLFCKTSAQIDGTLRNNGGNGGNGSGAVGGTAGAASASGTLIGGSAGVAGNGNTNSPFVGSNGTSISPSIGASGGSTTGFTATTGGTATATKQFPRTAAFATWLIETGSTVQALKGGASGASASGNAAGGGVTAASGGSGGGGGLVFLATPTITIGASGLIQANGGNAGTSVQAGGGSASGSGGGGGGCVVLIYATLTNSGSITANGGTGAAGVGSGNAGGNGSNGYVLQLQLSL